MPKPSLKKKAKKEEWETAIDEAAELMDLPETSFDVETNKAYVANLYALASGIASRAAKVIEKIGPEETQALKWLTEIIRMAKGIVEKSVEQFQAEEPRTIDDARTYANGKGQGTYLALLDGEGYLVRTMIVDKTKRLEISDTSFKEETISVDMKKRLIVIETNEGTIEKPVSGGVVKAEPVYPEYREAAITA